MARKKIELEVKPVSAPPEYPDLVESAPVASAPMEEAVKKRGRPKGSKNKLAPAIESALASPPKAEPNTVLVASVAEEVMRKIIEKREKSKAMTEEAEEGLKEGKEIEEKRKMWEAHGPAQKKEKPPIPEELKEKKEESLDVTKDVRESTEALVMEKAEASEARELLRKKKFFEEREELAKKRRLAAAAEAQKLQEKLEQRGEAEKERLIRRQEKEVGEAVPKSIMPEKSILADKEETLQKIRRKYAQFENHYTQGEEERSLAKGGGEHKIGAKIEVPKEKNWWEKIQSGWDKFWNEGRK